MTTTIPYLHIQILETIIRLDDIEIHDTMESGDYQMEIDDQWFAVYVNFPRVSTSAKPVRRMELSSANQLMGQVLRVYKRVSGESTICLKNREGKLFTVNYGAYGSKNSIYVSGKFEKDPSKEPFPFQCHLNGEEPISGIAGETSRLPQRYLYLEGLSVRQIVLLMEKLQLGDVLLEEIL